MRRLLRWLRPKRQRFPYGIPRVERGQFVTTYHAEDPFWRQHHNGVWSITLGADNGGVAAINVGSVHINDQGGDLP
jgi:predicted NUDIX family NTP pyrophosphohydrolase